MRARLVVHSRISDGDLLQILSDKHWMPGVKPSDAVLEDKARAILEDVPESTRVLASRTRKAVIWNMHTDTWGTVTGELEHAQVYRLKNPDSGQLRTAMEELVASLQEAAREKWPGGRPTFHFAESIKILARDGSREVVEGDVVSGDWKEALRDKWRELVVFVAMLFLTGLLVAWSWPTNVPDMTTIAGHRAEWWKQFSARGSTATMVTSIVIAIDIVLHKFSLSRHRGIRWRSPK